MTNNTHDLLNPSALEVGLSLPCLQVVPIAPNLKNYISSHTLHRRIHVFDSNQGIVHEAVEADIGMPNRNITIQTASHQGWQTVAATSQALEHSSGCMLQMLKGHRGKQWLTFENSTAPC